MSKLYSDWAVYRYVREGFVAAIVAPVIILSVFRIGSWDYFLSRISEPFVQEYYLFAFLAFAFSFVLLKKLYRNWLPFFGISTGLIGSTHVINFISYWEENTKQGGVDYLYAVLLALPSIAVVLASLVIWRQQGLSTESNTRNERVVASIGLLLTFVLMIAEYIPWIRSIHKATSDTWRFRGSGSNTYINECCYVSDGGFYVALQIYIPLIALGLLFLYISLGYRIPTIVFLPSILWCAQESIDFLTGLGIQNPLDIWTSKEIADNGLTLRVEGLFGGYLFVAGVIALCLLLLAPRILSGRRNEDPRMIFADTKQTEQEEV